MSSIRHYDYDVALSFAGEDRIFAVELFEALRLRSITAFYDEDEKSTLWGKNLYAYLSDVYQNKARYCVMLLSQHYAAKQWTNHEREAAQARAFRENEEYILPVRLDNTQIPGVLPTTGYLSWHQEKAEGIAEALLNKLRSQKTSEQWFQEGNDYSYIGWYKEAVVAYDYAIHLNPENASAHNNKSWALNCLDRFEEALIACEQALHLDPNLSAARSNKRIALQGLGKSGET